MPANYGLSTLSKTGYSVRVSSDGRPEWKIGGITLDPNLLPTNGTGSDLVLLDGATVKNGGNYLLLGTTLCRVTLTGTKTVTITGGPSGGTFTITATTPNGTVTTAQTTTAITQPATAATVQAALVALSNVGAGNVTVTGSTGGASSAEINTMTPGTPTAGDTLSVFSTLANSGIEIVTNSTATATATTTQLKAAWNGNPLLTAIGTASGTTTFIVTGVNAGQSLGITSTATGTGTLANVVTAASVPYTITFPNSLGPVTLTASGAGLTGGSTPAAVAASTTPGGNVGLFGPFLSTATDGRQSLNRGDCFVLDETWLDTAVPAFPNQGTVHPAVFDGGRVDKLKLVLSTGQGSNSLPAGYPAGPTSAAFLAAFPRIALSSSLE